MINKHPSEPYNFLAYRMLDFGQMVSPKKGWDNGMQFSLGFLLFGG
jgi:hypothetical protein